MRSGLGEALPDPDSMVTRGEPLLVAELRYDQESSLRGGLEAEFLFFMVMATSEQDAVTRDRLGVVKTPLNRILRGRYAEARSIYKGQRVEIAKV